MSRRGKMQLVNNFLIMKKTYLVLLLASLTLSACGASGGVNKNNTGTTKNEETPKTESSKSLKELLGLGTSQKCTFESKTDDTVVKSEIIMSGKKFKQTSIMTNVTGKGSTTKVYAVSDGIYYYSWSDMSKEMGTKMKIDEIEKDSKNMPTGSKSANTEAQQQISMDKKIAYQCTPSTLTDSDLAIPKDIKFVDYSDILKGFQGGNLNDFKKLVPSQGE